jgi:F-type H+-transporting ATPase subunit b
VLRARKNAEAFERDSQDQARTKREELLEQTRKDIDAETRRAIEDIRTEVADLTIKATEKITGRVLTADDQKRLVDEALTDLDFSALSGAERRN